MDNRTLTIKRVFDAPCELVWDTWKEPKHIAEWWGRGADVNIEEHDFTVGGKWRYTMPMPGGGEFVSEGIFSEIVEHKKIVSSAAFKPMTEGVIFEAVFEADGDKTKFTFNVIHPTAEYKKQQEDMGFYDGWGSVFEVQSKYIDTLS